MRATDILPPCAVWKVFSTSATASLPALTPSRAAVSATPGASWRSAFNSRSTPFARVATPSSTGTTRRSRNSLARSSNTLSRGGSISSSNCSMSWSS